MELKKMVGSFTKNEMLGIGIDVEGNINEVFGTKNLMNPKTLA